MQRGCYPLDDMTIALEKEHAATTTTTTTTIDEMWLVINSSQKNSNINAATTSSLGETKVRNAALVSAFHHEATSETGRNFPNGYSIQKVTSLEKLRDALQIMLPLPSSLHTETIGQHQQRLPFASIETTASFDEVKHFELFRGVIEQEDELLNQRVSWIILAQLFLMAAFITSTSSPNSMPFVTASVGLATMVVTMPAIIAAGRNIEVQQQVCFHLLESDERSMQLHGHGRRD